MALNQFFAIEKFSDDLTTLQARTWQFRKEDQICDGSNSNPACCCIPVTGNRTLSQITIYAFPFSAR